jgi:hypothetical protein
LHSNPAAILSAPATTAILNLGGLCALYLGRAVDVLAINARHRQQRRLHRHTAGRRAAPDRPECPLDRAPGQADPAGDGAARFGTDLVHRIGCQLDAGPTTQPMPRRKRPVLSFSQALRYEVKDTGVSITALMPGPADTEFFDRAGRYGRYPCRFGQEGRPGRGRQGRVRGTDARPGPRGGRFGEEQAANSWREADDRTGEGCGARRMTKPESESGA